MYLLKDEFIDKEKVPSIVYLKNLKSIYSRLNTSRVKNIPDE